jgi:DNA-binding MarR family transcriptional regulator
MFTTMDPKLQKASADLKVALGRIVRRLRQGYVDGELTMSEHSVLARIDHEGPATPGALANLEHVRPQAMGVLLAALVERGLVARRPDDEDGRKVLMSVTEAGMALLTDRRSHTTQRIAAVLEDYSPAEMDTLLAAIPLLERLADGL